MRNRISARELFDELQERLGLRWLTSGQRGGERILERSEQQIRRPSLAGYLNVIHPNKVQIVGAAELAWLDTLDARQRWETLEKIIGFSPMALVVSQDQACPTDLRSICDETGTALWVSSRRGFELLNLLQYHMALALAPRISMHGVFMEIFSIGVLITGESGAGKSELALELISRGHRLVADDAPEFTQIAPDVLDGTCPDMLQDMLEVRGLGVMNIRQMFGDTAVKRNKYLRLIVHLVKAVEANAGAMARLTGESPSPARVLDLDIPVFQLPVAAGRNLAVLTEAAVRLHMLRVKGLDPAAAFLARHATLLSLSRET
ncbi:HPr(Ser) kinase/phosphatase [soil metagenome]